ncbi:TniQ family protein [Pseudomonas putida]|uniref:TniQ family protein n=1 Tax=Pseudomonas putida TaxID=303 RepID=UPI00226F5028|nr:TniQ family protein [Pseudomonas putida]WAB99728.1 TniQ family protein [Pseudomonas putida]
MAQLNFIPYPLPNESPLSVLYRCAHSNGFRNLTELSAACGGLHYCSLTEALTLNSRTHNFLLSQCLANEQDALERLFFRAIVKNNKIYFHCGKVDLPRLVIRSRLTVCPECIRDGQMNIMHTFEFSAVCPIHAEVYISICPACQKPLNWKRIRDFRCACNFDLRQSPPNYADNTWSKYAYDAYLKGDQTFFDRLELVTSSNPFFPSSDRHADVLDSCIRMASGNKTAFFHEMHCLQARYPSLHKRLILAPYILINDPTISNYALEYYCNTLQSKPQSHGPNCECSNLPFTRREMQFVLDSKEATSNLIESDNCTKVRKVTALIKSQRHFKYQNLCLTLAQHQSLEWDTVDILANPADEFKPLTTDQAAVELGISDKATSELIVNKTLKSILIKTNRVTTKAWIEDFKRIYVIDAQLFYLPLIDNQAVKRLLEHTPTIETGGRVRVHLKKHLPQYIRDVLEAGYPDHSSSTKKLLIDINSAAALLNLNRTDIGELIKLGVLTPSEEREGLIRNRKYFTEKTMAQAIQWRKKHLRVSEAAELVGCRPRSFVRCYLDTHYITSFKLDHAMVTLADAKKCARHFQKYTVGLKRQCFVWSDPFTIRYKSRYIKPLPKEHPDAIPGLVIFHRKDYSRKRRES